MTTRFHDLPAPQQAGILCNDPRFRAFAATRCGIPQHAFEPSAAAQYLRDVCGIESRRDLTNNPDARTRFDALKTEFDAWTGRIPQPR